MPKFISWNVNGLRAIQKKGFYDFVASEDPDILCLQEVKAKPAQVTLNLPQYEAHWNEGQRPGYSGVLTLTKVTPLKAERGLRHFEDDTEGRVMTLEFPDYFLVNVYTPNSQRELTRLTYRQKWDELFFRFLKELEQTKPVIVCGDLNVAHKEIDLARPQANRYNAGFTDEERAGFERYMQGGFVDTFRHFCPDPGHYTWWSYMNQAREKNIGWRIDYFCTSPSLTPRLRQAFIRPQTMGSDHCPVGLVVE